MPVWLTMLAQTAAADGTFNQEGVAP